MHSVLVSLFAGCLAVSSVAAQGADLTREARRALWALEYHASISEGALQAPNRAQNLRARFHPGRVEVIPRTGDATWTWSWTTRRVGRGGALASLPAAAPTSNGARVAYTHPDFTEWYENRPEGIEQGFLINARPGGGSGVPVRIEGRLGGDLAPAWRAAARDIDLIDPTGAVVLRYGGLVVRDATGLVLPAHLECDRASIALCFDDTGAQYPILVDPVLTTPSWTHESNQAQAHYGQCVATAGDVNGDGWSDLLIGAPDYDAGQSNEGRAFLFLGSASGLEASADWMAEGNQADASFGAALAAAGDVDLDGYDDVVVGAPLYDQGQTDEGRVFLYRGSAGGLLSGIAWSDEGDQTNARFGSAVASAGDVDANGYLDLLIGADHAWSGQVNEGKAYVYEGAATGFAGEPSWTGQADQVSALFGYAVAGAGDVNGDGFDDVVIGAPNYLGVGRAMLYLGSAAGVAAAPAWSHDGSAGLPDRHGHAVAGIGDVNGDGYADVAVGAPGFTTDPPHDGQGRGVVFLGSSAGLGAEPAWDLWGENLGDGLGASVAAAGDVNGDGYADLLLSATEFTGGESLEGNAYLYFGNWLGLSTTPGWTAEGNQEGAAFGACVATAGDVNGDGYSDLAIGAALWDGGQVDEGRVSVYHGSGDGPQDSPGWVTEINQADAMYGAAVAAAGDVNGDGMGDLLVGAPAYDNGQDAEGVAFLFLGAAGEAGLSPLPAWYAESNQANAGLGTSLACAGDVNGDGYEDVLIGAPYYQGTLAGEGAAFLWYGTAGGAPMGNPSNAAWRAYGGQTYAMYGQAVSSAGDVNGDGYLDVIVGAHNYDNGQSNEGAVFAYYGSAAGLSTSHDWFHDSDHAGAFYGQSVACAGDWNGDGYSDVIVGAPLYDHPTLGEGAAFVYVGSKTGLATGAPQWYAESNQENAMMGLSVAGAGDVNGDGYSDVLIGAPAYDTPHTDGGAVYLWYGAASPPPTGNPTNADQWMSRPVVGANLGFTVASAGDVNGDGYSDVIAGAPFDDGDVVNSGTAFLWLGGEGSLRFDWSDSGTLTNQDYGYRVASAGDVNGDGFSDIVIGSPLYDGGQNNEGRVFLYYGGEHRGAARIPQQMQAGLVGPLAPLALSDDREGFALRARGRTPAGRGTVRLVCECAVYPGDLDGSGATRGAWTRTAAPVSPGGSFVSLSAAVSLTGGPLQRWRLRFESTNPLFPRSPWFHLAANGAGEADLRNDPATSDASVPAAAIAGLTTAPNPFLRSTRIHLALPHAGVARVTVHDATGRLVRTLLDGELPAGSHDLEWDGRTGAERVAPAGTYWIRCRAENFERMSRVAKLE